MKMHGMKCIRELNKLRGNTLAHLGKLNGKSWEFRPHAFPKNSPTFPRGRGGWVGVCCWGNPGNVMGKSGENPGKILGESWECHGVIAGNTLDSLGKNHLRILEIRAPSLHMGMWVGYTVGKILGTSWENPRKIMGQAWDSIKGATSNILVCTPGRGFTSNLTLTGLSAPPVRSQTMLCI